MADWYGTSREGQLHIVKTWNGVFVVSGVAWGIPQAHITQLADDALTAETTLDKVKSGERTPASVVLCNTAFKNMETEARFIKKHYLLIPPLTLADFATLLLPQPDATQSPVPPPPNIT